MLLLRLVFIMCRCQHFFRPADALSIARAHVHRFERN
jgi:hypothetical protein